MTLSRTSVMEEADFDMVLSYEGERGRVVIEVEVEALLLFTL